MYGCLLTVTYNAHITVCFIAQPLDDAACVGSAAAAQTGLYAPRVDALNNA